jgi:CHAT domain-containing protein
VLALRGEPAFKPLPGTRREVRAIADLVERGSAEPTVLVGPEASEQRLAELASAGRLRDYRFLHFATHAVMDDQVAMRSALILSQEELPESLEQVLAGADVYDGRLTADQIVCTWKLDADLVTLSACETALGKASGGEGFLGFAQALFMAGARSVVLGLWKVDDVATAILMEEFYRNLLEAKMSKAEALQSAKQALQTMTWAQAQQRSHMPAEQFTAYRAGRGGLGKAIAPVGERRADRPFDHPYYWAAFILIGSPE